MYSSIIQMNVQDYDQWRVVFNAKAPLRNSFGCTGEQVYQDISDPNRVIVILDWESPQEAQAHAQSTELREAMQEAGVLGQPSVIMTEQMP